MIHTTKHQTTYLGNGTIGVLTDSPTWTPGTNVAELTRADLLALLEELDRIQRETAAAHERWSAPNYERTYREVY